MAARSIATLSLSFGLVSIPVKVYSATESAAAVRFKLMAAGGARVRQQYVTDSGPATDDDETEAPAGAAKPVALASAGASRVVDFPNSRAEPAAASFTPAAPSEGFVVERSAMVKGYEFEKGRFVLFTADELKALAEASRQTIDIVSFIPEHSVAPIYYDKAYFLAPDKRGAKPYSLLLRAMRETGRCALAKWAFRSKEYVVEIRPDEGGMVLQQLLYAEEVRSAKDLDIGLVDVGDAELELAKQLIEQIAAASYDPSQFVDEEKKRILAAVEAKIAGQQIAAPEPARAGARVVDLVEALRASLQPRRESASGGKVAKTTKLALGERKPVRRATAKAVDDAASRKSRAAKR